LPPKPTSVATGAEAPDYWLQSSSHTMRIGRSGRLARVRGTPALRADQLAGKQLAVAITGWAAAIELAVGANTSRLVKLVLRSRRIIDVIHGLGGGIGIGEMGHVACAESLPDGRSCHYRCDGDERRLQELPARFSGGAALGHGCSPTKNS